MMAAATVSLAIMGTSVMPHAPAGAQETMGNVRRTARVIATPGLLGTTVASNVVSEMRGPQSGESMDRVTLLGGACAMMAGPAPTATVTIDLRAATVVHAVMSPELVCAKTSFRAQGVRCVMI